MTPVTIRLDVHAHLIPLRAGDLEGLSGAQWVGPGHLRLDGVDMSTAAVYQPDALLNWMDSQGVQQAWISVPPTLYRQALEAEDARRWAQRLNQCLARAAATAPHRLAPLFHLPLSHPGVAAELVQAAAAAGQHRFAMPVGDATRGLILSDASCEPLWQALQKASAFVFMHPSKGCDARFDAFYLQNLLNNPSETALAAAHLAMSGVLERHPAITFCLAHAGGATAAAAGRLARGQDTQRPGAYLGGERIGQALRRFCVDCIAHDAGTLQLVAQVFGPERILFGSDWPFDMGLPQPHTQLAAVDPALRQRIFDDNAAALLRIGGPRGGT
jgi:aminocarboxymuconate-semialdehyde decarboxylase